MANIHSPERQPGESQKQYRERRAAARESVKAITAHAINKGLTNSRKQYREDMRAGGSMGKRIRSSDALMAAWAGKRVPKWKGDRDSDGKPITLVGRNPDGTRRIWLAGISEQRGY